MTDQGSFANIGLRWVVDQGSLSQVKQSLDSVRKNLADLGGDAAKDSATLKQLTEDAKAFGRDATIANVAKDYANLGKAIKDNSAALKQMQEDMRGIGAASGDIDKATQSFKAFTASREESGGGAQVTGLRRTGSALSQLGFTEAGSAVTRIGDVAQIAKQFGQIKDAMALVGNESSLLTGILSSLGGSTAVVAAGAGLFAAAIGILVAGINNYNSIIKDGSDGLKQASDALKAYYAIVETGTTASINTQIKALEVQKSLADAELKQRQDALNKAFGSEQEGFGGDAVARLKFALASLDPNMKANAERIAELTKASAEADSKLQGYNLALGSSAVAANDAAEAEKKLQAERDNVAEGVVNSAVRRYQLEKTASSEQLKDRLAAIAVEKAALEKEAQYSALHSDAEQQKLEARIKALASEKEDIEAIQADVAAREKGKQATKDFVDGLKSVVDALKKSGDEEKKRQEALVAAKTQYDTAVENIQTQSDQARIDLAQRYADKQIDIAQKAVDVASQSLEKLEQKYQDLQTGLDRDLDKSVRESNDKLLDDQIKAQRQERDDLQQHLENLKQIRDRDASRERDDQLNRNYRDLFALKEQKAQDIGNENDRYGKQQVQRQEALQNEEDDQARSFDNQRRERLIAYQNAQADAQLQYQRELELAQDAKQEELQQAATAYSRELRDLSVKETNELNLKRQAAIQQLSLIQQTEEIKRQVFQETLNQAYSLLGTTRASAGIQSAVSTVGNVLGSIFGRAEGGPVMAGRPYIVNDDRTNSTESFNGTRFPPGLGLFIPARSGNVQAGSSGPSSITISMPISGVTDPVAVGRIAEQRTRRVLKEYFH